MGSVAALSASSALPRYGNCFGGNGDGGGIGNLISEFIGDTSSVGVISDTGNDDMEPARGEIFESVSGVHDNCESGANESSISIESSEISSDTDSMTSDIDNSVDEISEKLSVEGGDCGGSDNDLSGMVIKNSDLSKSLRVGSTFD